MSEMKPVDKPAPVALHTGNYGGWLHSSGSDKKVLPLFLFVPLTVNNIFTVNIFSITIFSLYGTCPTLSLVYYVTF